MPYFRVEPEVPGCFGVDTVLDRTPGRDRVLFLHLEFEGWLGDELVTSHPAFAATRDLADRFIAAGLSGVDARPMRTTRSEQFERLHPHRELPEFVELVVTGRAGHDDFGTDEQNDLVLSDRTVALLLTTDPVDTEIEPWPG